jgi:hypothetical protein
MDNELQGDIASSILLELGWSREVGINKERIVELDEPRE